MFEKTSEELHEIGGYNTTVEIKQQPELWLDTLNIYRENLEAIESFLADARAMGEGRLSVVFTLSLIHIFANDVDKLEIITGSNLPMIIELLFARDVYKRQSMTFIGTPSVVCPVVLLCRYTQRLGHATRLNQLPSGIVPQMHAMTGSPCGLGRERTVHDQGAREGRGRLVHPV